MRHTHFPRSNPYLAERLGSYTSTKSYQVKESKRGFELFWRSVEVIGVTWALQYKEINYRDS